MSVLFSPIFVAINFFVAISATNQVPVLIWSPKMDIPSVPGLKQHNSIAFKEFLHDAMGEMKPLIAVFLENTLSMEDFNLRQSEGTLVYADMKQSMSNDKISFIPSVVNPEKVIKSLTEDGYDLKKYKGEVPTELKNPTVLVITLSDDAEKTREQNLRDHLKQVSQIYKKLANLNQNVLAIYTGKKSSYEAQESHVRLRREEPKEDAEKYLLMQANDFVIVATNITYKKTEKDDLVIVDQIVSSELVNNKTELKVTFPGGIDITFVFDAEPDNHQWAITHVTHETDKILLPSKPIWAPRRWSWFCAQEVMFSASPSSSVADPFVLTITGLQAQPYIETLENGKNSFGQPMDCMPYFSIAIWTGIFIVLLMLFILGWGLGMLMDINTNDRFDDPKGKTITISAAD